MAKHKCPEFENHERWLVSYADMVTLLFALFVVLYALKEDGQAKNDAAGSLEESFNKPLDDIPPAQRVGPNDAGFGVFENMKGGARPSKGNDAFSGAPEKIHVIDNEMNLVSRQLEERLYGPNKFRQTKDPGTTRVFSVVRTANGFRVRLLARHFYDEGKISIKPSALKDLSMVTESLKKLGRHIRVEGHTDLLREGQYSHWDISALRATHVLKFMVEKHNFPPTSLSAAGYGRTRPIASNSTTAGRAMNRRIEFNVRYQEDTDLDPP